MPRYDVTCPNGHEDEIVAKWDDRHVPCAICHTPTERVWKTAPTVHGDALDYIDDNLGHEPIHITSKAQRRQIMKERGLIEAVRHVGQQGSDKSPHTSRWI